MVFIFKFEESSGVFSICNASFSSWNLNFVAQVDDMRNRGSDKFITWSTAYIRRDESVTRYTILSGCAKSNVDFALIAQGHQVMRNPKITHCPTSEKSAKGADKHLSLGRVTHTGIRTSDFPARPEDWGRLLTTPVLPSSVESNCPWRVVEFSESF